MKFLWILESGIRCLIFLLLSVFLSADRGASVSARTALPFRTSTSLEVTTHIFTSTEKGHSASITSTTDGTRAESATATIQTTVPGTSNITGTSPGDHSRITATPSMTTTQGAGRQPPKFWAIILICLTVTGVFIGGYVGCCFLCKKNIF